MNESVNPDYFVDGFYIKHFKIFPVGCDVEDFFDEQKIFLMYLIGNIPTLEDWSWNCSYYTELESAKNVTVERLNETEIEVARLKGESLEEALKEKTRIEKESRISAIKKKYHVKEDVKTESPIIEDTKPETTERSRQQILDILQLKGLVKVNGSGI